MMNKPQDNQQLDKIIYSISHDLGAPLRAVVQFSQLLSSRLENRLDEKEAYWFRLILEGGTQAQSMLEELVRYSRLSSEKELDQVFSLNDMLDRVIEEFKSKIVQSGAQIEVKGSISTFKGSPSHWHLYLTHLLGNALLYQPLDTPRQPQIIVTLSQHQSHLSIVFEDNGIGVAADRFEDIVLPFKRLRTQSEYSGLGMGLSYCLEISRIHGGDLNFGLSSLGGLKVIFSKSF